MVFMDPVTTTCEACGGSRYSDEALSYLYKGKNIVEILNMSAEEAEGFFSGRPKICRALHAMVEVGLPYLSLGQPLSTLSGGERQRVKLAKYLGQKGNIYVLDEPTTGLHASEGTGCDGFRILQAGTHRADHTAGKIQRCSTGQDRNDVPCLRSFSHLVSIRWNDGKTNIRSRLPLSTRGGRRSRNKTDMITIMVDTSQV